MQGPLEIEPTLPQIVAYDRDNEIITRILPVSKIPLRFVSIEFLEYGTAFDSERQKYREMRWLV